MYLNSELNRQLYNNHNNNNNNNNNNNSINDNYRIKPKLDNLFYYTVSYCIPVSIYTTFY